MWESVDGRKNAFPEWLSYREVYYINITTSTKGTHSASNFGNNLLLIIPIEPRSLDSLFSYSSQRHSVKRQRRSWQIFPWLSHLRFKGKIWERHLAPATSLISLPLPALLLMLQLLRHSPDSPGLLLCTFFTCHASAETHFLRGPHKIAPLYIQGFAQSVF